MLADIIHKRHAGLAISLIVLTILYLPVYYSDYAYLDEAHQLWHNKDHSNYSMFLVQGRWLTGLLFDKLFSQLASISDLKFPRIIAFFSWALFLVAWFQLGKKWQSTIGFSNLLLVVGGVYIACSLSVTIYIGWASCFQAGLASLLALWGGSILFQQLTTRKTLGNILEVQLFFAMLLGVISLFLYQIAFGAFLIPFTLYFISKKNTANAKIILTGILVYTVTNVLYYLLFKFSISQSGAVASERTSFSLSILDKLSFFFSLPLSQAFSFNFLYNLHSVISQAFPFLMIIMWVTSWVKSEKTKLLFKLLLMAGFITICMFIYLPLLAGKENFSSYRTMFSFNFVVSLLLVNAVLSFIREKNRLFFASIMMGIFIVTAIWNYRFNFIRPLKQEYKLLNAEINDKYHPGIDTIYFLRPPENAFLRTFGINSYKDEFGVPSTFKDWTPEPLMKQLIFEKTGNRTLAEKIAVFQFTDKPGFETGVKRQTQQSISIDRLAPGN